jgi:hypothetical protein
MYRKLLERYLEYLGKEAPHHGIILFHLHTFADWLDLEAAQHQIKVDKVSTFPPGKCFNCGLPATHKTDTGLFLCGNHAVLAMAARWHVEPLQ